MDIGFQCIQDATPGYWTLRFNGPTPFVVVHSWEELKHLSTQHETVLALGLFDWNVYSHALLSDICDHEVLFKDDNIGLAVFCPGSAAQVESICPAFLPYYFTANADPFMLAIKRGSLQKVRFGPLNAQAISRWLRDA